MKNAIINLLEKEVCRINEEAKKRIMYKNKYFSLGILILTIIGILSCVSIAFKGMIGLSIFLCILQIPNLIASGKTVISWWFN